MIGGGALAIWMDVDGAGEADLNAWYPRQHLPERLAVPGFLRGRRYAAVGTGPAYFTFYETEDAAVLTSAPYLERLDAPTDWTRRVLPLTRMVRSVYRTLATAGASAEPHVFTARVAPEAGARDGGAAGARDVVASLLAIPGVTGAGVYASETGGSSVVTEERRLVGDVRPASPLLVIAELADPEAEAPLRAHWEAWRTRHGAAVTGNFYRLMYGLAWLGRR